MIPSKAHFVWFGNEFPWLNVLAIVSAATRGDFEQVILHLDGPKGAVLEHQALSKLAKLEVRPIDVAAMAQCAGVDPEDTCRLFDAMTGPAARADVVRALVLATEGGVYLDMDTITLGSFDQLRRDSGAFIGQERICFPGWHMDPPNVAARAKGYALAAMRFALSTLPRGYLRFAELAHYYSLWANNAVMGCEANHPFMRAFVKAMLDMPIEEASRPYAMGPDLLERVGREYEIPEYPFRCLEPSVFYPLPPVICEQWWNLNNDPRLEEVLVPATLVVHWYASVRNRKRIKGVDPAYILAHKDRQLFAKLAYRYVDDY